MQRYISIETGTLVFDGLARWLAKPWELTRERMEVELRLVKASVLKPEGILFKRLYKGGI
jgi:hypothetical protein